MKKNYLCSKILCNMEVIMVRHTSVDVPKGTCYGWSDVPVAATFCDEAAVTKAQLDSLWKEGGCPEAAFTSPLTRARVLARYCGFEDATVDRRLMEMNMGDWEMQRYDDIADPYLQQWYDDYLHLPTPHGESFPMQCERVGSFLRQLLACNYRRVVVFAHGGVLGAAAICSGLYTPAEAWQHLVPYGGILRLDVSSACAVRP